MGRTHWRVRVRVPSPPQEREHGLHGLQGPRLSLTLEHSSIEQDSFPWTQELEKAQARGWGKVARRHSQAKEEDRSWGPYPPPRILPLAPLPCFNPVPTLESPLPISTDCLKHPAWVQLISRCKGLALTSQEGWVGPRGSTGHPQILQQQGCQHTGAFLRGHREEDSEISQEASYWEPL